MSRTDPLFTLLSALLGFLGVAAGALATHAIAEPYAAARVSTAALYALIHAAVLLSWRGDGHWETVVKATLFCGTLLFSGGLTLAYVLDIGNAARFAPIGGTLLLAGWLLLALTALRNLIRKTP